MPHCASASTPFERGHSASERVQQLLQVAQLIEACLSSAAPCFGNRVLHLADMLLQAVPTAEAAAPSSAGLALPYCALCSQAIPTVLICQSPLCLCGAQHYVQCGSAYSTAFSVYSCFFFLHTMPSTADFSKARHIQACSPCLQHLFASLTYSKLPTATQQG